MFTRLFGFLTGLLGFGRAAATAALGQFEQAREAALILLPSLPADRAERLRLLLEEAEKIAAVVRDGGAVAGQPQVAALAGLAVQILALVNERKR
jgi:hypothetical protein